jgi:hypothetical protein
MLISDFKIYVSYNQFMVYDKTVDLPGNDWTEEHSNQGFARRDSSVCFGTLIQFGDANVQVFSNSYVFNEKDERVIKVPFYSPSGLIFIEGPEEESRDSIKIEPGYFLLTAAQQADYENETLLIRLYFLKTEIPFSKSEILIKDEQLNPPNQLLETAEIALI